jgi:hypothetical protein
MGTQEMQMQHMASDDKRKASPTSAEGINAGAQTQM